MLRSGPVRGRDKELQTLRQLCRAAIDDGRGGLALIEGPPGIGKSQLLLAAGQQARDLGMTLAAGGADEVNAAAPLAPLLLALDTAGPSLLGDGGVRDLGPVIDQRLLLVEHLATRLEEASAHRPLVITLDDLQWADAGTLFVLRQLPPRLRGSAVVWLLARRDHPCPDVVNALFDSLGTDGGVRLALAELSSDAVADLVGDLLRTRIDDGLRALLDQARGSPFLAVSLVDALTSAGALRTEAGTTRVTGTDLPVQFRTSVRRRLRALSASAREMLQVGAVLGRTFRVTDATALLGWSITASLPVVDDVLRAGLVADTGDTLTFRHDLLRQALYEDLPRAVRTSLHREVARTMTDAGRDVLDVVPHLLLGARTADRDAVAQLTEAAARVASVSPQQAADLMLHALDLTPLSDPARVTLAARAIPVLAYADRRADAEALATAAFPDGWSADTVTAPEAAQVALGLATMRWLGGDFPAALQALRDVLAVPALPAALRAPLVATYIDITTSAGPPDDDLMPFAAEAQRLATDTDEPLAVATTSAALAQLEVVRGNGPRALRHIRRAVPLWDRLEPVFRGGRVLQVMALAYLDRFAEAEEEIGLGRQESERFGAVFVVPIWHQLQAIWQIRAGAVEDAQAEAETSLNLCAELGGHQSDVVALGLLAHAATIADDDGRAHQYADRVRQVLRDRVGGDWSRTGVGPAALAFAALGDTGSALALLEPAYRGVHGLVRAFHLAAPSMTVPLTRLALQVGDRDRARQMAAIAAQLRELNPEAASARAADLHVRGLIGGDLACLREAERTLADAPPQLRGPQAWAVEDLGLWYAEHLGADPVDTGDDVGLVAAVDALERAWERYAALGWTRDQLRVQRALRRLGKRHRGWATRGTTPTSGWGALTPAERRVAELAAQGHTNRRIAETLFLSPHTVNTHLGKVFAKLNVRSRVQLARLDMPVR